MQDECLERLPDELKQLVLATEQAIGFSVEVVFAPERGEGVQGEPNPLACEVEKDSARMLVPTIDQFRPSSVFHELQHIRRFLVEGEGKLVVCEDYEPWAPAMGTALTKHDNAFEHLVIVPRELHAYPESREKWERVMARVWGDINAGQGPELALKQLGLACWVFLRLVLPDSPTVTVARAGLASRNELERAERFCDALSPVLADKQAAIKVWFEHQEIPLAMASLKYFAPLECRAWEVPLATDASVRPLTGQF